MPRVSIVVPSYNHEPYLRVCLDSVQAQTYTDWEMVVVDDLSTDQSLHFWRSVSEPRLRVFRNDHNLGTYGTQNRGVSLAQGEYVAILNSDDFWGPEKLARQVALMDAQPELPLCYTLGWRTSGDGTPDLETDNHGDWPTEPVQDLMPRLLEQNNVLASSVLFRRRFAAFDETLRYSGDWIVLLQAALRGRFGCIAERDTYWRIHGESSHRRAAAVTLEEIRVRRGILDHAREFLSSGSDRKAVRQGLGACALHLAALYVLWGDMGHARQAAAFAVRRHRDRAAAAKRFAATMLPRASAVRRLWSESGVEADANKLLQLEPLTW